MALPPSGFPLWRGRLTRIFPPISHHGRLIVTLAWSCVLVLFFFLDELYFLLSLVLAAWCTYFFRDPVRYIPDVEHAIIAPADGKVIVLEKEHFPRGHPFVRFFPHRMHHIAIFMDIFDCHVNRSPLSGKLLNIVYKEGSKKPADVTDIGDNEQQAFLLEDKHKRHHVVIQIAGQIARRIVKDVHAPSQVETGDKVGMILFGSRVDLYLPPCHTLMLSLGQRTIAGETIVALAPEVFRKKSVAIGSKKMKPKKVVK